MLYPNELRALQENYDEVKPELDTLLSRLQKCAQHSGFWCVRPRALLIMAASAHNSVIVAARTVFFTS